MKKGGQGGQRGKCSITRYESKSKRRSLQSQLSATNWTLDSFPSLEPQPLYLSFTTSLEPFSSYSQTMIGYSLFQTKVQLNSFARIVIVKPAKLSPFGSFTTLVTFGSTNKRITQVSAHRQKKYCTQYFNTLWELSTILAPVWIKERECWIYSYRKAWNGAKRERNSDEK